MNSLAEHKNRIVRRILDITDENILRDIDAILGDESTIITTSGKKLSEKEYIEHIESISNAIKNGTKTYTSQEVRASILNRKQ